MKSLDAPPLASAVWGTGTGAEAGWVVFASVARLAVLVTTSAATLEEPIFTSKLLISPSTLIDCS